MKRSWQKVNRTCLKRGCVRSFHERQKQTESEMKGLILIRLFAYLSWAFSTIGVDVFGSEISLKPDFPSHSRCMFRTLKNNHCFMLMSAEHWSFCNTSPAIVTFPYEREWKTTHKLNKQTQHINYQNKGLFVKLTSL